MAPSDKAGAAKPPVAPDLDQILNRVSLAVSKSQRLFSQAHKAGPSSSPSSSFSAPANTLGSFSSPGSGTRATPPPQASASRYAYKTATQRAAEDADFEAARNLPPNAGLGYVAPGAGGGAEAARRQREEQFALRRKLGLKGTTGTSTALKRGPVEESESEEEAGRSGLGRTKKIKVRASQDSDTSAVREGGREEARKPKKAAAVDAKQASGAERRLGIDAGAVNIVQEMGRGVAPSDLRPTSAKQLEPCEEAGPAKKKRKKKKSKKAPGAK